MKKNKYKLLIVALLFSLASCEDNLNLVPQDQISSATFWTSPNDALLAVNGCYDYLEGDYGNPYWDGSVDNAYCQYPWESTATSVSAGDIDATIDVGYNSRYQGVRRFNYFLDNVDKVPGLNPELKKRYISEVRFMRAFVYFKLCQLFGPVPLLKNMYDDPTDAAVAPTTENEVINYVIAELKEISEDNTLPTSYSGGNGNEKGRITRGAAVALKARVELYYGKYADAVQTAQKVMQMGYSLFRKTSLTPEDMVVDYSNVISFKDVADKERFYKGLCSYEQQFWQANEDNSEFILVRQYINNSSWDRGSAINTLFLPPQLSGWASITPTQELVNAYWNRDGSKSTPPTPADRAKHYNKGKPDSEYINEFKNRDTRLYASIFYTSSKTTTPSGIFEYNWYEDAAGKIGYAFRKLIDMEYTIEADAAQDFPIIRYAEILLTYAEAKNELSGPSADIFTALNDIRDRAGMPNVDPAVYNTKEKLREMIRNERRIELAGEGHRYDDIRRWGIAKDVMKPIYDLNNSIVQDRYWEDKFIRMPYPQSALDHNSNLGSFQQGKGY